jgi:cysteine-rich repeat protein
MKLNLSLLLAALFNAAQVQSEPVAIGGVLCGEKLPPGEYTAAAACSMTCPLELDPQGNANAEWTIACVGAITIAANIAPFFTDTAGSPDKVIWSIGGATTTGAGSEMMGTLESSGAITLGADAKWIGPLTSTGGAVGIGARSIARDSIVAFGAISVAANAVTGDLTSTNSGAVTVGADAETGDITTTSGPVVLGADARVGAIGPTVTITFGARAVSRVCGNNKLDDNEQCDPPNGSTCTSDCKSARCGDGIVTPSTGEQCDGGNNMDNDGCQADCTFPTSGGGVNGDPHFKTWRGHHFDFHGECDLVLLHSSEFGSGLGLDVHIRTKLRRDMSYISSATIRIGRDVLEVESQGIYHLNGVLGAELPDEFSGFAFSHTKPTDKQHVFTVHLGVEERINAKTYKHMGVEERITVKTYKNFVSILIENGQGKNFGDSVGLMGDFGKGRMLARDGQTILDDANAFGQEWQVLENEASFFQRLRLPQHPMECTLPPPMNASQLRRRLMESSVDELTAEKACARWGEGESKDDCVFDVLTTGDLEMAVVGAY